MPAELVHVCSFSALDDLPARSRTDARAVLAMLTRARRFSVFEATEHASLALTLDLLFRGGFVKRSGGEYPWTNVEVTEIGQALIDGRVPPPDRRTRWCDDCHEEVPRGERRSRCKACGRLVCAWCDHHVHGLAAHCGGSDAG
jgi:hypothetical protein